MVNTYVSSFSLAASRFPRRVSSKGLHTWWKATAQNELLGHWHLPTYLFIYLSSYVSFRNPCGSHFQSGIALIPLWRKRAEMTHMGWGQKWGFSDLPCGCVDVVFGKSIKALQFGALWKQKRCEGMWLCWWSCLNHTQRRTINST